MFNRLNSIRIHFAMAILLDVFLPIYWLTLAVTIIYMYGSFIPIGIGLGMLEDIEITLEKIKLKLFLATFSLVSGIMIGLLLKNRADKYYKIGIQ